MRSLAVFRSSISNLPLSPFPTVEVDHSRVRAAILVQPDAKAPGPEVLPKHVLVRVLGFSCNYRDRTFIHHVRHTNPGRYFVLGSEFVGQVVEVGEDVSRFRPGDRVISNHHYTGRGNAAAGGEGVVTNHASREFQLVHESRLVGIPHSMSSAIGAAFSLSAQTAYSMVRKADIEPGSTVLVCSATSNTSLFLIAALAGRARAVALTSNDEAASMLHARGVEHTVVLPRDGSDEDRAKVLRDLAKETGGFDAVLDPFADLHIAHVTLAMAPFGRYVTCGVAAQNASSAQRARGLTSEHAYQVLYTAIVKNLSIIGNCIGLTQDLEEAVRDFERGQLDVPIDSVFTADDAVPFLHRTFVDHARFGKVVFQYEQ